MTDVETLALIDGLERCTLSNKDFHHRDHLTVAVAYLYHSDVPTATDQVRAGLIRFAAHLNITLYHDTITRFWVLMAEKHLDRNLPLAEAVERVHLALNDKDLIYSYYSRERIGSAEAKAGWVEPDLRKIK
jgi:hypothetical protein